MTGKKNSADRVILIIGATGLVGSLRFGFDKGREVIAVDEREFDITKKSEVFDYISEIKPQSIILLAAYTNVDEAEKERDLVWKVNVEGASNVAQAAKTIGSFLIYISTDYVFPGSKSAPGPHSETDIPPKNAAGRGWYAQTKYEAELGIKSIMRRDLRAIVRIAFPFGNVQNPRDYTRKILEVAKAGSPLFTDQRLTPTFIPDLWVALARIESKRKAGIWHVATRPVVTPYELGAYLTRKLGLKRKIKKGTLGDYLARPGVAPRYFFGGLKTEKTEKELGLQFHTWRGAIAEIAPKLLKFISKDPVGAS